MTLMHLQEVTDLVNGASVRRRTCAKGAEAPFDSLMKTRLLVNRYWRSRVATNGAAAGNQAVETLEARLSTPSSQEDEP